MTKDITNNNFKYHSMDDAVIIFKPKNDLNYAYTDSTVINIAQNTKNTWQKNRDYKEVLENTVQGKIVEEMLEDYIETKNGRIKYMSYDLFRNDNYKKHAPIDGIIFRDGNPAVKEGIKKILEDIDKNQYGKLEDSTFNWLSNKKVYTVEIKSSRIPDKDYPVLSGRKFNSWDVQNEIISNLSKRDFFVYPKFTRTNGTTIHNFNDYVNYVIKHFSIKTTNSSAIEAILTEECKGKCDIYTRIFVDKSNTENMIAYMLGYALKSNFFEEPKIINMPRKGKSENAIYYAFPISKSNHINRIFNDGRLW